MLRSLAIACSLVAVTCLEFFVYPGHSYLAGASQYLVAMIERLAAHGFLSRDLAAVNPVLTFTIYDEVTLFLQRVIRWDWSYILGGQQFLCRFAGIAGTYLLGSALKMPRWAAVLAAALIGAVGVLPGVAVAVNDPEPTPYGFSIGLTLLALGCLAQEKPLLASLFGGIALAYDPVIGSAFWLVLLAGTVSRKRRRPLFRPTVPALIVFNLLLGNAAQLQPGRGEAQAAFGQISPAWLLEIWERTPSVCPSHWDPAALVFYAGLGGAGIFAAYQLSRYEGAPTWVHRYGVLIGLICIPFIAFAIAVPRWSWVAAAQPARILALATTLALMLCAAAGIEGWRTRTWAKAAFLLPLALVPVLCRPPQLPPSERNERESVDRLAEWARLATWGGSLFYFADAGRSTSPGRFRAEAMRAVYVDWISGDLVPVFPEFAREWQDRWQLASAPYSASRLQEALRQPVDYVVLHRRNALRRVQPDFETRDLLVYDAHNLQNTFRLPTPVP